MSIKSRVKYGIKNSLGLLVYLVRFGMHGSLFRRLKSDKDNQNERVFVLGNGPSLNKDVANVKEHIEALQKEEVLMVNQSITSELCFKIKPSYYLLMDPAYFGLYSKEEDEACCLLWR